MIGEPPLSFGGLQLSTQDDFVTDVGSKGPCGGLGASNVVKQRQNENTALQSEIITRRLRGMLIIRSNNLENWASRYI